MSITKQSLLDLGMVFPVFSGVQIDLNAVDHTMPDGRKVPASLCDHNCTEEVGNYTCPAAFTLNRGIKPRFASKEAILRWIEIGRAGLILARDAFLANYFGQYCQMFRVPLEVEGILRELLRTNLCEVNLFGGNPEMHPEVLSLVRELKREGFRVNLTTTGRRLLTSQKFASKIVADPPHLLALSADDFDPACLDELFQMSLPDLVQVWKKIGPLRGQSQKFVEGIFAAKFMREHNAEGAILFNMVLHHGNLRHAREIMHALAHYLPGVLVNPYPAQDSFLGGNGLLFAPEDLVLFGELIDFFIAETVAGNPTLTKRLQYWLVMKAILEECDPAEASQFLSGHGTWQCYRHELVAGAGMYLQIGKRNPIHTATDVEPGGHAGCYWQNETVTMLKQISSAVQVASHVICGQSEKVSGPCPGCSMPRLWFNSVTTELGLNPRLVPRYLDLRLQYVGF